MMRAKISTIGIALVGALALGGCARGLVRVPRASRPIAVAQFNVAIGPQVGGDRANILMGSDFPGQMQRALRGAYPMGQGPMVQVIITEYSAPRNRRYGGPARMHAVVQVIGPRQNLLAEFQADSTTTRGGSRYAKTRLLAQDIVNQVAARL